MKQYKFVPLSLLAALLILAACAAPAAPTPSPTTPGVVSKPAPAKAEWEQKWEAALSGAKKEGTLSLFGIMTQEGRTAFTTKLREKFGINFEFSTGLQSELLQKMTMEQQAGLRTVDMFQGSATAYIDYLKPRNMVTRLDPYLILPEVKEDKYWLNSKFPMFDQDRMVVILSSGYFSYILLNTELVKEGEVRGYRDLLNPKLKGKMVMLDPTVGPGPSETFVNFFIPRLMGREAGERYLRDLVKQDIAYVRDARLQVEWVAKEKYPIAIAVRDAIVADFTKAGASIAFVRPEEGGMLATAGTLLSIIDKPPHPNAATVFLNYVLTDEGQGIFANAYNLPPRKLGVPFTGTNQFAIVLPGDKTFESDEAFYLEGQKTAHWVKEIFGPVVSK